MAGRFVLGEIGVFQCPDASHQPVTDVAKCADAAAALGLPDARRLRVQVPPGVELMVGSDGAVTVERGQFRQCAVLSCIVRKAYVSVEAEDAVRCDPNNGLGSFCPREKVEVGGPVTYPAEVELEEEGHCYSGPHGVRLLGTHDANRETEFGPALFDQQRPYERLVCETPAGPMWWDNTTMELPRDKTYSGAARLGVRASLTLDAPGTKEIVERAFPQYWPFGSGLDDLLVCADARACDEQRCRCADAVFPFVLPLQGQTSLFVDLEPGFLHTVTAIVRVEPEYKSGKQWRSPTVTGWQVRMVSDHYQVEPLPHEERQTARVRVKVQLDTRSRQLFTRGAYDLERLMLSIGSWASLWMLGVMILNAWVAFVEPWGKMSPAASTLLREQGQKRWVERFDEMCFLNAERELKAVASTKLRNARGEDFNKWMEGHLENLRDLKRGREMHAEPEEEPQD
jgi:hypothetical protein